MARPGFLHVPPHRTSAGAEVADLAESAGLVLDEWQRWVLDGALGERDDGKWAAFEVGLCCPRQNGKSAILEAVMLGALFLDGGETLYSAHEFKTAQKIWARLDGMVRHTPELNALVFRRVSSTNEMGLELFDGSKLQFVARSGTSGRGFSADRLIFDEAMILSATSMGAMIPTMSAKPNAQVWYAGSAGMVDSDHWRSLRDRGRKAEGATALAWFEWGGGPVEDLRDRSEWAARNPGYPDRITDEAIERELETLETREETLAEWVRERLGIWDEPDLFGQVIGADVWLAHANPKAVISGSPMLALDVSPNLSSAAIAVCGDSGGRPLVEITSEDQDGVRVPDHREGLDWLVPRVVAICRSHDIGKVHLTGDAAKSFAPALEAAGLEVAALTGPELAQACATFYHGATTGPLLHAGQPELDAALACARQLETDHGWKWAKRKSGDITCLVAATVAYAAHVNQPATTTMFAFR